MNLALTLLLICFETYYNNHVNYKTYKDPPPSIYNLIQAPFFLSLNIRMWEMKPQHQNQ